MESMPELILPADYINIALPVNLCLLKTESFELIRGNILLKHN